MKKDDQRALVDALYELVQSLARQLDAQEERIRALEQAGKPPIT